MIVGFAAGNEAQVILWRAIVTMVACWFIGRAVGGFAQHIVDEHIAAYKRKYPLPEQGLHASSDDEPQDTDESAPLEASEASEAPKAPAPGESAQVETTGLAEPEPALSET